MSRRLHLGAEAEILEEEFLGQEAIAKRRLPKTYRHPELDARIRRERTRLEATLLSEARHAGVAVPAVLDIDEAHATLRLQRVPGRTLRELMVADAKAAPTWARRFGDALGRLHAAGLVHGDPTTSNAHGVDEHVVLLDFGLGGRSHDVEDLGVDIHLVERTFEASHPERPDLWHAFVEGYRGALPNAERVLRRMDEIKSRARYA